MRCRFAPVPGSSAASSTLNGFGAAAYPMARRSTGVGWALGVGRLGDIMGPLPGGTLLGLGVSPSVLLSVRVAGFLTMTAILILGLARGAGPRVMRWPSTAERPGT